MTSITFDLSAARQLFAHARDATDWATPYGLDTFPRSPGLLWVKDQGTYLMSNGLPRLTGPDGKPVVVYAHGLDATADWNLVQDMCGGDDFVELIDTSTCDRLFAARGDTLHITLSDTHIEYAVTGRQPHD